MGSSYCTHSSNSVHYSLRTLTIISYQIEKKSPEPTASTPTLWQILMGHAPAASAGTADLLESSDEDIKEECESSDEDADMGFGLFD
jgi:hypothetical protein